MPVFETGTFNHSVTCPHDQRGSGSSWLILRLGAVMTGIYVTCGREGRDIARFFAWVEQNITEAATHKKGRQCLPFSHVA